MKLLQVEKSESSKFKILEKWNGTYEALVISWSISKISWILLFQVAKLTIDRCDCLQKVSMSRLNEYEN